MSETPSLPLSDDPSQRRGDSARSGEDAVRRAAQTVVNRTRTPVTDGAEKRTRRRSRRERSTPLLAGNGLQFHYAVGFLLLLALATIAFSEKLSKGLWRHFHPVAPPSVGGLPAVPTGPAPWWFRAEVPVLLIGFAIWLYLTPGVWDRVKSAIGLNKDGERLSRRRSKQ